MPDPKKINIANYNYVLPEIRIAKYPLENRNRSKVLVYQGGVIKDDTFSNVLSYISSNSLVVFNNTRVIQARMIFKKETGARVEIFCLSPYSPADYSSNFRQNKKCSWKCIVGNSKKWKSGNLSRVLSYKGRTCVLNAARSKDRDNIIEFTWDDHDLIFSDILDLSGQTPIPPYLSREPELPDKERYQTVYSKHAGSVAAPTAGLHFTPEIIRDLELKGIAYEKIVLHVGAGTFVPVRSNIISDHIMHTEYISVSATAIENIINNPDNVLAVGTTTLRTLESLYHIGVKISKNKNIKTNDLHIRQWEPYEKKTNIDTKKSLDAILEYMHRNKLNYINTTTQLIIVPGYDFKIVSGLITNYHQPKSTLLLLVAAFTGEDWEKIYSHALENDYRFLSYGDCSLLYR